MQNAKRKVSSMTCLRLSSKPTGSKVDCCKSPSAKDWMLSAVPSHRSSLYSHLAIHLGGLQKDPSCPKGVYQMTSLLLLGREETLHQKKTPEAPANQKMPSPNTKSLWLFEKQKHTHTQSAAGTSPLRTHHKAAYVEHQLQPRMQLV